MYRLLQNHPLSNDKLTVSGNNYVFSYKLNPKLIGVNNRDLKRFVTDVLHTNEILENKKDGYYYISESGIRNQQDVENIVNAGIDGLLIGESLMKCGDLSQFLRGLKLEKVKV